MPLECRPSSLLPVIPVYPGSKTRGRSSGGMPIPVSRIYSVAPSYQTNTLPDDELQPFGIGQDLFLQAAQNQPDLFMNKKD